MNVPDKAMNRIKNIYALANDTAAAQGERDNAMRALLKDLSKFGMTLDDLKTEERQPRAFMVDNQIEHQLLTQIISKVLNTDKVFYYKAKNAKKKITINLSTEEYMDVVAMFNFYRDQFRVEVENLLEAFFVKHHIYPISANAAESADVDTVTKIYAMAKAMKGHTFHRQIT